MLRRDLHNVVGTELVGPYTLLRVERGSLEPGVPGQFFMLEAPGRVLPRPMSLSLAPTGELGFLFEPIGPGTEALAELSDRAIGSGSSARWETGSGWTSTGRCSSAAGSASRRFPTCPSSSVGRRRSSASAAKGMRRPPSWSARRGRRRADARDGAARAGLRRARLRAGADAVGRPGARARLSACPGGADGVRLRRLLRLCRRDRRPVQAALPGGAGPCCLTRQAASTRSPLPTWPAPWTRS